ncbi:hypothetical protein [Belliella pelovolcani]|uniref:Uncharacterized protein n=1 Tax=Belliella pelovolcani TaxID=529505 RepID=A0A1N7PIM7_9BACT|nr:hypothetical protein [Belliella pelovolcani]SIT10406.1 hypothetical protein SAMN05421761_11690 [Belliella pelovolcani]
MKTSKLYKNQDVVLESSPNLELIKSFFLERDSSVEEAELFFFYYEALGWRSDIGAPILDWKAAARQWLWNLDN